MNAKSWGVLLCMLSAPWAWAGQYVLQAGQANTVPVAARVLNGEQVCNLQITVPGQAPFEREVRAPFFETRITLTPVAQDSVTVRWQGQFKRVNGQIVNACPTQGEALFKVEADNALTRAVWAGMLTQLAPAKAECVRSAFAHDRIRPEWFDFTDPQVSAEDAKIDRAFVQCHAFLAQPKAWGQQNPTNHACTVGGIATRCEGIYTARIQGRVQTISKNDAMLRQLESLPWGTGVREMAAVRAGRAQQDKNRLAQVAAQEVAKQQAIEDARLQAEQQVINAKAAEQRALQEKISVLRAKIAEDKAREAQERNWLLQQMDKVTGKAPAEAPPANAAVPAAPAAPVVPVVPVAPAAPLATVPVAPAAQPAVPPAAAPTTRPVVPPAVPPAAPPAATPAPTAAK